MRETVEVASSRANLIAAGLFYAAATYGRRAVEAVQRGNAESARFFAAAAAQNANLAALLSGVAQ